MRLALLALLVALPAARLAAQETGLAVGSRAPAVTVHDLDGSPVDLGRWVGRQPVLLEWWATWCEECDRLLPRLQAARAEVGDAVEFVAVNVAVNQSPEKVRRFVADRQVPFVVLYDDEGASTRAYEAPTTSYVVIVDRAGRVAYTGVGGDQPFLEALRRVATP
ncbi:MAG TPA: TlpA disulfide reductase family protein [Gemmatimonadales bacterium]|nr:TlpA disulfide reductase family protein [Gemmatimonadales bacterium]